MGSAFLLIPLPKTKGVAPVEIHYFKTHELHVEGNSKEVLTNLVGQYEKLFGKLSREVCRDQPLSCRR
jgi:hypothetical protein